jgi:GTP-binding protein Era
MFRIWRVSLLCCMSKKVTMFRDIDHTTVLGGIVELAPDSSKESSLFEVRRKGTASRHPPNQSYCAMPNPQENVSSPPSTRCGTVALLGEPNAGKSTLLNALIGEPLAITSSKPQTTWVPVVGVRTDEDIQVVFVDPPGIMSPSEPMHEAMLESVQESLVGASAALYVVPRGQEVVALADFLPSGKIPDCPILVVRSKSDERTGEVGPDELAVSARKGKGLDDLLVWCQSQMPLADFRYDVDDVGTQSLRFFATEYVREAAFELLGQELPYSVAVEVEEFRENSDPMYIRLTAYVERDGQKGIFVGKGGATIKKIGGRARKRMEALVGAQVYLDLWVKVRPKWRKDPLALQRFGYSTKKKKRKRK